MIKNVILFSLQDKRQRPSRCPPPSLSSVTVLTTKFKYFQNIFMLHNITQSDFFYSWWYYVPNFFQTFALFRFSNRVIVDPELRGYSHPVHLYLQALFSQVVHLYALQLLNQLLIVDCLIDKLKRFMGRNYWT